MQFIKLIIFWRDNVLSSLKRDGWTESVILLYSGANKALVSSKTTQKICVFPM